jgi:aldehyde dehydrogenase (NAD+)
MSGNLVFNDTFQQLAGTFFLLFLFRPRIRKSDWSPFVADLPFGGVGESGYGRQVGFYSAQEFLYPRAVVDIPQRLVILFLIAPASRLTVRI